MKSVMDTVFENMENTGWAFVGGVEYFQLPKSKKAQEYYAKEYGENWLYFRRVFAKIENAKDFFARNYEEVYISQERLEKDGTAFILKEAWSIPNDEYKWDNYGHILSSPSYTETGCSVQTAFDATTEFGIECLCRGLDKDSYAFFSREVC